MTEPRNVAVIGGGLAGLSTAYQLSQLAPQARITLFEKGGPETYSPASDSVGRASLSASPARIIRYTGGSPGAGQWAVQETKAMLDTLQADMQADPATYGELSGKKLLTPQASVIISPSREDLTYCKNVEALKSAGAAYEEIDGATLKGRFPNLYASVPDNAAVLVESPAGPENAAGVSAAMDVESTLKALILYLGKRGADIRLGQPVQSVVEGNEQAVITTAQGAQAFDQAVVAPGQWMQSLVNAEDHGIKLRYDRVVLLDIDMKALGLETSALPMTKGLNAGGEKASLYTFRPDAAEGHVKFIPAGTTRSVATQAELKAPLTEEEIDKALTTAAAVLNVDMEKLRAATTASTCAYTAPKVKENPLVARLSEHITVNGIDSSSTARTSGGLGKIAASLAAGREEPYPETFTKYGLEAHRQLVAESPEISQGGSMQRLWRNMQISMGF
ncbi:MAG: FAD-binding oxidoreductase [Rickettsiales bacterium]|nr:FAD-binding oxidoreductase [Rickettsiales bacterium]